MQEQLEGIKALAREASLAPQEQMQAIDLVKKNLIIGIPKECAFQEKRVALTPGSVSLLVSNGHRVLIEDNAGTHLGYKNNDYLEAGAEICSDNREVYKAEIILKVAPPTETEIEMMVPGQVLMSALQLSTQPADILKKLMSKKVSAIAWEHIKDDTNIFPVVRSMGEMAGRSAIFIAAEYLSKAHQGKGIMFGGIAGVPPTNVVILGAGTVGETASKVAIALGAQVKVFDNNISKLRRLQNDVRANVFTSIIEPETLSKAIADADVVIGALRSPNGRTPCVVTEEMVASMREASVIVDVSIDQGGCFETSEITTHNNPIKIKHGVLHYGVPNIASRVPITATQSISNIFAPIVLQIGERGGVVNQIKYDKGFRNGVYIFNGTLTNSILGSAFGIDSTPIEVLIPSLF